MNIKTVTDRECFTVKVDWKDIPQLLKLSTENFWVRGIRCGIGIKQ